MKREVLITAAATGALLLGAVAALAQDAVKTQPDKNKVLFENERVRVIEVKNEPGGTLKMHSHPDHVVYLLENSNVKFTSADGKVSEMKGKKGEVRWVEAVTHTVENKGSTPVHAIVVELKEGAK
jgi:quercetin dioxygenase-like cupin family protein